MKHTEAGWARLGVNTPEEGPHRQKRFLSPVNFFHKGFINLHPPGWH